MRVAALVMAGGSGERMQRSLRDCPKPLVKVLGVPLLERSLYALFRAAIDKIFVSFPAASNQLAEFVHSRCVAIGKVVGAEVHTIVEARPLGNIGCAARVLEQADVVLVVFADNLTTLNLRSILEHHQKANVIMTVATHYEPFAIPFGQIETNQGFVVSYLEKPKLPIQVCSAITVLDKATLRYFAKECPMGLSDLVNAVIQSGERVSSFHHSAPWVDVNNAEALTCAEAMLRTNANDFESWAASPSVECAAAIVRGPNGFLFEKKGNGKCGQSRSWDIPSRKILSGEASEQAVHKLLSQDLGVTQATMQRLVAIDEVDTASNRVVRYYVHVVNSLHGHPGREGKYNLKWVLPQEVCRLSPLGSVAVRTLPLLLPQK